MQEEMYFIDQQPPRQSDFGGHNERTTFYLEANGLPSGVYQLYTSLLH